MGQKMPLSKSEERNLKSQGNSRQILQKGPRQKTAGAHGMNTHMAAHTSHNFNKDMLISGNMKSGLSSAMQS
jgi:hypothetical protein